MNAFREEVVLVSSTFARAVRTALDTAAATDGLVDPTLGDAIVAAGYDRDFAKLAADTRPLGPPSPGRWREVSLTGRLLSRPVGLVLDLNGVVKGMVADEALRGLPAGSFVAVEGDVATSGPIDVGLPGGAAIRLSPGVSRRPAQPSVAGRAAGETSIT